MGNAAQLCENPPRLAAASPWFSFGSSDLFKNIYSFSGRKVSTPFTRCVLGTEPKS